MTCAACGIGIGQKILGRANPDLVEVLPELALPTLPLWLTAPEALRTSPRIRRMWDFLATNLGAWLDA
ncbi:hypothetical protein [Algicella marina]|uniref:LysR substrate-binding domain-containing protein n=1 Tax=Algicella marina TaxID=2683284 RepID=A0A6P1T406_9RHOB|nr:hypothetical protein [Algicella marina]QHQ36433.1 hypothetical protein GO499_15240 [Algicella marina]